MKHFLLVFLIALIHPARSQFHCYNNNKQKTDELHYEVWKVYANEDKMHELSQCSNAFTMWGTSINSHPTYILVKSNMMRKAHRVLRYHNIKYKLYLNDLNMALRKENPRDAEVHMRRGFKNKFSWEVYHRINDINAFLEDIARKYPDLCTIENIGYSIENRTIKLLKLSNGNPSNKAIWIDGGIHAREWISPATVTYIIDQLVRNFRSEQPQIQNLNWYFVPVLNPDGYEYTHLKPETRYWRKNRKRLSKKCYGVDLNRNFGYKWGGKGVSKNPCADNFGGTKPFSEPESQAVRNFILKNSKVRWTAYLSFHSFGQFILFPFGYDTVDAPNHNDLAKVAKEMKEAISSVEGTKYTVGSSSKLLYPAAGGSDDWALAAAKFNYSFTVELRGPIDDPYMFMLPAKYIVPTGIETFEAVRVLAKAAWRA